MTLNPESTHLRTFSKGKLKKQRRLTLRKGLFIATYVWKIFLEKKIWIVMRKLTNSNSHSTVLNVINKITKEPIMKVNANNVYITNIFSYKFIAIDISKLKRHMCTDDKPLECSICFGTFKLHNIPIDELPFICLKIGNEFAKRYHGAKCKCRRYEYDLF